MIEFHIGDKVRNIKSGSVGIIKSDSVSGLDGHEWMRVVVILHNTIKVTRFWAIRNIEKIEIQKK